MVDCLSSCWCPDVLVPVTRKESNLSSGRSEVTVEYGHLSSGEYEDAVVSY